MGYLVLTGDEMFDILGGLCSISFGAQVKEFLSFFLTPLLLISATLVTTRHLLREDH